MSLFRTYLSNGSLHSNPSSRSHPKASTSSEAAPTLKQPKRTSSLPTSATLNRSVSLSTRTFWLLTLLSNAELESMVMAWRAGCDPLALIRGIVGAIIDLRACLNVMSRAAAAILDPLAESKSGNVEKAKVEDVIAIGSGVSQEKVRTISRGV